MEAVFGLTELGPRVSAAASAYRCFTFGHVEAIISIIHTTFSATRTVVLPHVLDNSISASILRGRRLILVHSSASVAGGGGRILIIG